LRPRKPKPEGGYRLIAVDLDGTLLDHNGAPHAEDLAALRRCVAAGIEVTIATGRLYSGTRPTAEAVGIVGAVACADGSHIVRTSDHATLLHLGVRGDAAGRIREDLGARELATFLFAENSIVHDDRGAGFLPYVKTWSEDVHHTPVVTRHPLWEHESGITAVVALGEETALGAAVDMIRRDLHAEVQVALFPLRHIPGLWGMIARARGGDKGRAVEEIARGRGIGLDACVAVGDWINDVSMLTACGRGFAMGQAPAEVKAAATDELEKNSWLGGGIAHAVTVCFDL
jgi:hydroxymethylpyrimidine pyrophosphatase-like HAD family hydrolase